MYTFNSRIRYSETDCNGKLSLLSLLNYFQDASTFQSEGLGVGLDYMAKMHVAWVLSSWQIVVQRYPKMGEEVVIGTAPYQFKACMGWRNYAMYTKDGEELAVANSIWGLLDIQTGKLAIPPKQMVEAYPLEEKLPMEYATRKIVVPEGGSCKDPIVIKKHHLDTNHHVNNGQYVNMAMDFLPENTRVQQLRVLYQKQTFLDDVLVPYVVEESSKTVVNLTDTDGNTCVCVEFLRKEL